MKNLKVFGIIALIAVMGLVTSCVTATTIGASAGGHGFFSGGGAKAAVTAGATEIGSYTVILGLFDSGYEGYANTVKAAEAEGKKITTTTTWYFGIMTKVTAYAQ